MEIICRAEVSLVPGCGMFDLAASYEDVQAPA